MFTGIIEELGRVLRFDESEGKRRLTIAASEVTRELQKGDSVAVSGVCLTVVEITPESFSADLASETVRRTSLSRLRPGSLVNLELPARAGDRLGGHIVQGHVDSVGTLLSLEEISGADDFWLKIRISAELAKYVVEKGSISIEGISLTVAKIEDDVVTIAIIPHTANATNLQSLKPGDPINIEVDVMAKYAEKLAVGKTASSLTVAELIAQGF
jgi:riboflavin synthase